MTAQISPEDRFALQDLMARYGWALDTGDIEAFVACFAPDGVMVEEVFEEPDVWSGTDGIRSLARHYAAIPNFPGRQHWVGNTLYEAVGADRVHARSFAMVTECQGEPPYLLRFCGWYEDELVRLDGEWHFQRRTVRLWDGKVLSRFPGRGTFVPRRRPSEFQLVKKP